MKSGMHIGWARLSAMLGLASLLTSCAPAMMPAPAAAPLAIAESAHWPRFTPGQSIGQSTGVAVGKDGLVYLFHRADREWVEPFPTVPIAGDTIATIDHHGGSVVATWGEGLFIMPHGLSLDGAGNVWVTDVGAHQVRKFSADGRLLLTLGEFGRPGNDQTHFNQPTDIAFGPDGTVYVTDGYVNTRVVRFTPDGRYLGEWGEPGERPGQFKLPHGVAVDREGLVYVADRENHRVQIFDSSGRFREAWNSDRVGKPYGVTVAQDGTIYVVDAGTYPETRARVVRLTTNGRVLGAFTAATGTTDGDVLGHDIAVAADGTIYVADAWAKRIRRLAPRQ